MPVLQSSLYSVALALCVFSTGLLSDRRNCATHPRTFLIGYLVVESLGFAFELLVAHPATPLKPLWLGLLLASSLLTAPCLWLAIREQLTGERPSLRRLHPGHGLAILGGTLLCLPLMLTARWGTGWDNPYGATPPWHFYVIHEGMLGCIGIFSLQVPIYLKRARRLMLMHSDADLSPSAHTWLHLPLLMVGTTWALGVMRVVQCAAHAPAGFTLLFALIDVSVTVGALYLILRRAVVSREQAADATTGLVAPAPGKYAKSPLDAALVERIRRKLEAAFAGQQVHHDSLLSLRTLSQHLHEKPHYVSQVINQETGGSFYDLVNRHRIAEARQRLRDHPQETVLEIALAVGFNAKSTFNSAFRRQTGVTPREYRAQTTE